ncbi:MAG TPA: DUF4255 domain-containing protein [Thermoanaerobaculia bacterium]|jgi:hypothetical protein
MSDYRALAAVSNSLRNLLDAEMELQAGISVARPDVEVESISGNRINLFLYKVDESPSLKNMDLPGRGHPGAFGRPPLSLDLHYLLTVFGGDAQEELEVQELLGDAMRVLHSHAIILGNNLDAAIRNEVEHIKLYLEPLSLEELSKIWSATTKPMRLSVSYLVTVVQIENLQPRKFPRAVGEPPVGGPRIKAVTFRAPRIDEVRVIRKDDPQNRERRVAYARIGDRLVLRGRDFTSDGLRVLLGDEVLAPATSIAPDRIELTVPDDAALQPGATRVVVQNDLLLGEPEAPHRGFTSNVAAFVIVPEVNTLAQNANVLTITGTRLWSESLDSLTIVGNAVVKDYSTETAIEIAFDLPPLPAGNYLVRVRVNGAESLEEKVLVIA